MNKNYYHQHQDVRLENCIEYGDFPEFMDFEYLRKNTCLNLSNHANLARSPSLQQDVKIARKRPTNFTNLSLKTPKSGKVKGYQILIRETTSAV